MINYIKELGYRIWYWIGTDTRWLLRYSKERDKSLVVAREALERAFTPQIQKMLEDANVK